jgi:nitrite reductase (NADH) small subunit
MAESVKIGTKNDIPHGESRVVRAKDKEIAVFNVGGTFYALDNACCHRGGPLGEGTLEEKTVTCPWHGWQFDVTTGASTINPAAKAQTFPVRVQGDDLFVEI